MKNINKSMTVTKRSNKRSKVTNAPAVTSAPALTDLGIANEDSFEESAPAPAPAPAPALVINGVAVNPVGSGELTMGDPINSKRITRGARIDTYRVVSSQRKTDNARYYVQGGFVEIHPVNGRSMFTVAVEIPYADLRSAQTRMVELNADLKRIAQLPALTA